MSLWSLFTSLSSSFLVLTSSAAFSRHNFNNAYYLSYLSNVSCCLIRIPFNQIIKRSFSSVSSSRLCLSLHTSPGYRDRGSLNPWFVTGFIDGEGSFSLDFVKTSKYRLGWKVTPVFSISLHQKDRAVLEQIKSYFGVGGVCKQGSSAVQFGVKSAKEFSFLIDHFDRFPLITQKKADYELWKRAVEIVQSKEHLGLTPKARARNEKNCSN